MRMTIAQETELQLWAQGPMITPPPHIDFQEVYAFMGWQIDVDLIEISLRFVGGECSIELCESDAERFVEKLLEGQPSLRRS